MLSLNYDNKFDVLYISFGHPRDSYGEEDIPHVVTLKDITTNEITGYTIMGYKELLKTGELFNLPLEDVDFRRDVLPFVQ